ncbi:MAG: hypothetical protein KUG79_03665 [Pseudomonadales bacterium]|nr:hypothetical protein [Pseudomonadales bacterium]
MISHLYRLMSAVRQLNHIDKNTTPQSSPLTPVKSRSLRLAAFCCLIVLFASMHLKANEQSHLADETVPITHISHDDSHNGPMNIPRRTIRAIYSMRMLTWPDGRPLTVFVLPDDHPEHQQFCRNTLGILPFQLRRSWDRLIFSGKGRAPIEVRNMAEMKKSVSATPGAIGYITGVQVDESLAIIKIL